MNKHGFTLLETLITLAIGSIVLLGVGSFYVATSRSSRQDSAQTFLQRQGVLIFEEMAQQIRPAKSLAGGCTNCTDCSSCSACNALQVTTTSDQIISFSQPDNTHLNEGTRNLLTGALVPLTVSNFVPTINSSGTAVSVSFQLQDGRQNAMTFTTALGRRN